MFAPRPLPPYGMLSAGNIDPAKRPVVRNPDGSISTVRTISVGFDNGEVLIPTVSPDGRVLSDDEAIKLYEQSGQNFGTFRSPDAATMFARQLHEGQAEQYAEEPQTMASGKPVTIERVAAGIRAANAKGDVETVRKLGVAYRQMQGQSGAEAVPPPELKPGSKEYALWARDQALAGKKLPQVSATPPAPEFTGPNQDLGSKLYTWGGSHLEGTPVIGPTLIDWAKKGRAAIQGMSEDEVSQEFSAAKEANPTTAAIGNTTGAVLPMLALSTLPGADRLLGAVGSTGARIGTGAASGGVISAADTAARGGDAGQIAMSGGLGALIGGGLPLLGAGIGRIITPAPATAAKTASADVLAREGVELTAGQRTGNQNLMFREAELGGRAAQDFGERQAEQFTSATLSRIGVDAPRATHDVLATAADDIGRAFDDTAARNFIQPDQRMARDVQSAWRRFEGSTNPSTRPPVIQRIIVDIYGKGNAQRMTGEWYKSTRSELGRLSKSNNPELAEAARDLQHALDDAMERTIQQFNPADLGAWQEVRRLYRNLLVIEDAATRAGADSAEGIITPQALRSAAMRQNKRAFARGRNDFVELADAGVSSMPKLPNSGTPGRLGARMLLPAGSVAGAALGNQVMPGLTGTVAGGVAGALFPWALGRAALSGPGRAYLGNQVAAGAGRALVPPSVPALLTTRD